MDQAISIPAQLKKDKFRFYLIPKGEKRGIEKNWTTTAQYRFDDPKLISWLEQGNNYGINGGIGNLLILDFDDKDYLEKLNRSLPETFTVKTGRGGNHKYYFCDNPVSRKVKDKDKTLVDIQGKGTGVVGPNSVHPNGNKYLVENELEIANIDYLLVETLFADYISKKKIRAIEPRESDPIITEIKKRISLKDLMIGRGYDRSKNPTLCLLGHNSNGAACFSYNESSNLWHCFNCDKGGDIFSFVMEHDNDDFINAKRKLMDKAGIIEEKNNKTGALRLTDYLDNVKKYHSINPFFFDRNKIFWLWDFKFNKWQIVDEVDILDSIDTELNFDGMTISRNIKTTYLEAFKRIGRRNIPQEFKKDWVQFNNVIYDMKLKMWFPVTPEFFATNPIPWSIGESEETPTLDNLFEQWVGKEYAKTLYEICAYSCLCDYPLHMIFCLVGSGCNGKSSFMTILEKFIGNYNCCAAELDEISQRFQSSQLYKKLICMMGETNWGIISKTSILKKLTGEDLINFEMKNINLFSGHNYAKIIIGSNSLPSSSDTCDGFYRRWLIVDFFNQFKEGKSVTATIPEVEFHNLARKCARILPELLSKGEFSNQGSIEERKNNYIMASNPLPFFISTYCEIGAKFKTPVNDLYASYIKYLVANHKRIVSWIEFKRSITEQQGLQIIRVYESGVRDWFIDSIKIKDTFNIENIKQGKKLPELPELPANSILNLHVCRRSIESGGNRGNSGNFSNNDDLNIPSFDFNNLVNHKCIAPLNTPHEMKVCNASPCNLNENGRPICGKHWQLFYDMK